MPSPETGDTIFSPKKILVADDEYLIRWSLTEVLSEEGYEVKAVENGEGALEAIKNEYFDFVITDLVMPGINGWQVLKRVKETYPKAKVIVITAYGQQDTEVIAKERGADAYIEKPEMLDKIMMLLRGVREGD
ncbi:MAG: response regulator [Deltaproteobacteria bacterium]|nr:MAG: response regulator [Deltaproteobacteria bacterium]